MKRIGKLGLVFVLLFLLMPFHIKAASATISVRTNKTTTVVGSSVTVTVTLSSASPLGAWQFDVNYDSSKLQLQSSSSSTTIVDYGDGSMKSKTYTYYFKTISNGTASVSVGSSSVLGYDESTMSVSNGSTSIRILTQQELADSYSKNNYLSALSVDGVELSPAFNKETLEYNVELEPETTSIHVNATKEDGKASVSGAGDVAVSEGENRINITVTAENGNVRTYVIKALVKELSPIEVTLNGSKYTVVRKKEFLTSPSSYVESTAMIQGEEVPAFTSEITGYILVGLKDSEGNIGLYIYDANRESYTLYQELSFDRIILYPMEFPSDVIKESYIKDSVIINDQSFVAYRMKSGSTFALLYGENVLTGEKGVYVYDTKEHTLQRYHDDEIVLLNEKIKQYENTIIILMGLLAVTFLSFIIFVLVKSMNKRKTNGKKKHKKKNKKNKNEESFVEESETKEIDNSFL